MTRPKNPPSLKVPRTFEGEKIAAAKVTLLESDRKLLHAYGNGNLSRGIRRLCKEQRWREEGRVFDGDRDLVGKERK